MPIINILQGEKQLKYDKFFTRKHTKDLVIQSKCRLVLISTAFNERMVRRNNHSVSSTYECDLSPYSEAFDTMANTSLSRTASSPKQCNCKSYSNCGQCQLLRAEYINTIFQSTDKPRPCDLYGPSLTKYRILQVHIILETTSTKFHHRSLHDLQIKTIRISTIAFITFKKKKKQTKIFNDAIKICK